MNTVIIVENPALFKRSLLSVLVAVGFGTFTLPDAGITVAGGLCFLRGIDIAQVDEDGLVEQGFHSCQVEAAELVPFGDDDEGVGALGGFVFVAAIGDGIAQDLAGFVHGRGVEGADCGALLQEASDDGEGWSFAHIVGVGFEGQAEEGDGLTLEPAEDVMDLLDHAFFLSLVGLDHGLDDGGGFAVVSGDTDQGFGILGEAGAAVAGTGMEEFGANPAVHAHGFCDGLNVGADGLADVGDLVDEGDLGGQEGVAGIFDQFGSFDVGKDEGCFDEIEGAVDLFHNLTGAVGLGADDDPVGAHKVADGAAFPEKFGVGDDVKGDFLGLVGRDDLPDAGAGADGDGGFVDDDFVVVDEGRDLPGHCFHMLQVGGAVLLGRCADGDKNHLGAVEFFGDVGGKAEPPSLDVTLDDVIQARFIDGYPAVFEGVDFVMVFIDANDGMAKVGKARGGNKADIACADNGNVHS